MRHNFNRTYAKEKKALVGGLTFICALFSLMPMLSFASTGVAVDFISQASSGNWKNDMFQNGCEEASIIMAMHWVKGTSLTSTLGEKEVEALSLYQKKQGGTYIDRSASDVGKLIKEYYGYSNVRAQFDITKKDIIQALKSGAVVIVPVNGRKLKNPFFTQPGPDRHMLLVIGHDSSKKQFITNDPGTRRGKGYRYNEQVLESALRDYPTGDHIKAMEQRTAMIVVLPPQK